MEKTLPKLYAAHTTRYTPSHSHWPPCHRQGDALNCRRYARKNCGNFWSWWDSVCVCVCGSGGGGLFFACLEGVSPPPVSPSLSLTVSLSLPPCLFWHSIAVFLILFEGDDQRVIRCLCVCTSLAMCIASIKYQLAMGCKDTKEL